MKSVRVVLVTVLVLAGVAALTPRAEAWHHRSHVFFGFTLYAPLVPYGGFSSYPGYPFYGFRYYPYPYSVYVPPVYGPPPVVVYQSPPTYTYTPPAYTYTPPAYTPPPPPSGRLQLDVRPDAVQIFVDGRFVGTAGALRGGPPISVMPGHHLLEFRLNGFTSATEVDVSPGSTTVVQRSGG